MRLFLATSTLFLATQAQLLSNSDPKPNHHLPSNQKPMADPNNAPGIQLPNPPSSSNNTPTGDVILSDILGTDRKINIFSNFCNSISSIQTRLDTSALNTTVLAPLNSAISSLPRKPWEDPKDYDSLGASAYSGPDGEDRAHRNLRRFVEHHVVPVSPWAEGEKVESVGGGKAWWEMREGKAVVMPGEIEVERVGSKVRNGEVWILKGVVNYA